ncbi:hypothetical protein SAMN03080617_01944 [Algoriphagus alkaliphilus]|uniref:Outer membrane protein beta-barrel domain-containing protein n=1 Tax=Algoriphagus alkaliphilus TaxID=279824 RepID=A0A1G5XQ92_9BACT|nr:hypothetical protein [Algoriphagus alkaliphilus]MBA4301899.1 hypothetical protein [Cyclobacterium sp.]SDA72631.1 hypothetical protein SAMN03080617_01944 [Algoriphagus alkaliphilus]
MKKSILTFLTVLITQISFAQAERELSKWTFGLSFSPDSYRYAQAEENGLYYQISFDRQMTDYLILGGYLGIQNRRSSYQARNIAVPSEYAEIDFEKQYVPLGIRFGFDLSSYFSSQLGWIKNESKWEILLLGYGGVTIQSTEIQTPRVPGKVYDDSEYPIEEDMNYVAGVNAVVRYFPSKNLGVFTELGYGPVGRYSFGVACRLR